MREGVGIEAEAYFLPESKRNVSEVLEEEDIPLGTLAKAIDFRQDVGIEEIHVTEELSSQLALRAVQKVMTKAGLTGNDIDVVIDFTSIPEDYIGPTWSAAGFIQREIDARNAFCTAITVGGCSSYHFALQSACALISSESGLKRALLFAGDRTPKYNKTYYPITVSSDGGSALILRKGCGRAIITDIDIISVGRLHDVWYVPGLGQRTGDREDNLERLLHMHCNVKKFNDNVILMNFTMFNRLIDRILRKAGKSREDIDLYIYPNFSTWDQDYFCRATGIPREKVYTRRLAERGHVQESDMVINYRDALDDGLITKGSLVMTLTNGAGFAWSAAIVRH
ncbi:MAG: 3-oxoacyl-[acyl-carrier-protein] synthase III C-terminal domain-containing protein [Deltaproteobacteria bacterium]